MVLGRQQGADVALEDEVRAVGELDGLGDLRIGGVHQITDLAADGLLPVRQGIDVGVDAWISTVGHGDLPIRATWTGIDTQLPSILAVWPS